MIASRTFIDIDRYQNAVLVDDLKKGDTVYDPLAGTDRRVVGIMSRSSQTLTGRCVRISAARKPKSFRDSLICSPFQVLLWKSSEQTKTARYSETLAHTIGAPIENEVDLFLVLLDAPGLVSANGYLAHLLSPADLIRNSVVPSKMEMRATFQKECEADRNA